MTLEQQEKRISGLMQREQDSRKMRYEWRKSLESGYEKEMLEVRKKVQDSKTEIRTGPTTIGALGSHYEQQLKRLKQAE